MGEERRILVTGDFVLDHHIYEGRRQNYGDAQSPGVRVKQEIGGAALVHDLLSKLCEQGEGNPPPLWKPCLSVQPGNYDSIDESDRAYAFWRPFPQNATSDKQFWLVNEAMGFGVVEQGAQPSCALWPPASDAPAEPDIIVVSEGGMGFRQDAECWRGLNFGSARWIVLKTASPVAEGALWEELSSKYSEKLVVVVAAGDLRESGARISASLSWEETLTDFVRESGMGGALAGLLNCRHLVVAFRSEGGAWVDLRPDAGAQEDSHEYRVSLIYDSSSIEGELDQKMPGTAFGFLSCLAAAVTRRLALDEDQPDMAAALAGGLSAMRDLRLRGHGPAGERPNGFPAGRLAEVIKTPTQGYSRAVLAARSGIIVGSASVGCPRQGRTGPPPMRSLLNEALRSQGPAYDLARLTLLNGPIALANLPNLRIGHLLTVDRRQTESLRTLSQTIRRYQSRDSSKKPLSIGVFGPPGSGKSFAVKELATSLVGKEGWMEFNLSQFDSPAELNGAFHQVRDRVLQGLLPVAFFDEFDSKGYRWLQFLLAPMQDGRFQEGQITHALGKAIFVFAGATSWSFETFGPPTPLRDADAVEREAYDKFRLAKGPDFMSRLDAYLDVVGPNRRQVSPPPDGSNPETHVSVSGHFFADDPCDLHFPVQRALIIRSGLGCDRFEKLTIHDGLACALLCAPSYTHGSRSLSMILEPFRAVHPGPLFPSLLLPRHQLAMHTDAGAFLNLCDSPDCTPWPVESMSQEDVAKVAPAIHEAYRQLGRKEGWLTPENDVGYDELDDFKRSSNRAAASRIPGILALVGLRLDPGIAEPHEEQAVRQHIEYHLELLADAEHEGWMKWHFEQGWRYAPKRNDEEKHHNCLLPFTELSDAERNKDREHVRHFPAFSKLAGLKIVFQRTT